MFFYHLLSGLITLEAYIYFPFANNKNLLSGISGSLSQKNPFSTGKIKIKLPFFISVKKLRLVFPVNFLIFLFQI
jgi:hypothetical protein